MKRKGIIFVPHYSKLSCLFLLKWLVHVLFITLLLSCDNQNTVDKDATVAFTKQNEKTYRVLFVNSYHQGYEWSDGIVNEVKRLFNEPFPSSSASVTNNRIELKVVYLDSKHDKDEKSIQNKVVKIKSDIESWKPDVLIVSDDNAMKYLVSPYYLNSELPVVFCGVNWDARDYGIPANNVTGILEVQLIDQLIDTLEPYAKGPQVAFLKGKDLSTVKEAAIFNQKFSLNLDKRFVSNFNDWKAEFLKLQSEADILLLGNGGSIEGWNDLEAKKITSNNTKIPTGNWDAWMVELALLTIATKPEEHGEWVAKATKSILLGRKPSEIPIAYNKIGRMTVNLDLAKKMKIKFPVDVIERAKVVVQ